MLINLKVKTLDAQTHEFSIDNEITVREFKDQIAEKTNIAADQQRIIYCGRVLVDEKQLKEYDVDGKVLHVAERPPPSQRAASSTSNSSGNFPNEPMPRGRPSVRGGMRNSPLFRALDGMVVGTMAIPMNASMNNGQMPVNPFTSSSSFCMNRITVARHMLECADNIAAYLEDPERGLNNTSLDILARGRWTMESTVVEVGITAADLPQNQNIVEMVQGAVSAALRRNGNTNVTVVQLPTVFGSSEGEQAANGAQPNTDAAESNVTASDGAPAAVLIEDVIDAEEDGSTNTSSTAGQAGSTASNSGSSTSTTAAAAAATAAANDAANSATSTGTNTDDNPARRRTGTRVLAEVIDQMRNVQTRLNPFMQQFYEMLQNEPTFEENDTTGREHAQRLYDRVSEAVHYMSHAQHAISDLMLDVSQPAPRYLTCRPIMVEQSGYVSHNNYLSNAAAAAAAALAASEQQPQRAESGSNAAAATTATNANANSDATAASATTTATAPAPEPEPATIGTVEDPIDDPVVVPTMPTPANAAHVGTQSNDNHQMQMARLIQAVVNSAPVDTEFHVQINAPSIVSFGLPVNANRALNAAAAHQLTMQRQQQRSQQRQQQEQPQAEGENAAATEQSTDPNESNSSASPPANAGASSNADTPNQARVNTATLPTTSTQTRSTSRPQLQIGNIPPAGWNGRFIPANMMSAFDRFLPCNSHHIREPENGANNGNGSGNSAAAGTTATGAAQQQGNSGAVGSTMSTPRASGRPTRTPNLMLRSLLAFPQPRPQPAAANSDNNRNNNLRTQLLDFLIENIFEGAAINADTIPSAVNRAVRWFGDSLLFLPQYEKPEYDSRDSVSNILQRTLPLAIELLNDRQETPPQFEQRLKHLCEQFIKRLYSVLFVCVGRANAELYWGQLMRKLLEPVRSNFHTEALEFLCIYINPNIPSNTDTIDAEQFIVHRDVSNTQTQDADSTPVDSDVEMAEDAACFLDATDDTELTTASIVEIETTPVEDLPNVDVGSEPWHRNFPNDWLPIITRDMQTQAETRPSQAPFSDAYISGMSAKRRKLIQSSKPAGDVRSLVADSVRKAIQTVGVSSSTAANQSQSADEITSAIANDSAVQASCTEAVRTSVRDRLKQDPDYKADKYPQTAKFVNK